MNNAPQATQATQASEYAPIDTLRADPRNARLHGNRNLTAVMASLQRFGQQKPIVVLADGTVIAGNGTLEAARRLGWTSLWVTRSTLSDAEAVAYGIADNRTAELAEWDPAMLEHLSQGTSLEPFFNPGEIDALVGRWAASPADLQQLEAQVDNGDAMQTTVKVHCHEDQRTAVLAAVRAAVADMQGVSVE